MSALNVRIRLLLFEEWNASAGRRPREKNSFRTAQEAVMLRLGVGHEVTEREATVLKYRIALLTDRE